MFHILRKSRPIFYGICIETNFLDQNNSNAESVITTINSLFSNRTVSLVLAKGNSDGFTYYVADVYGVNNDLAGTTADKKDEETKPVFLANSNHVEILLENNKLNFERIKGGKQVSWRDLDSNNQIKPLTGASGNVVYIKGGT